jgi:hypothetical protein
MVEHLPHHPKAKGSSLVAPAVNVGAKIAKTFSKIKKNY